MKSPAPTGRMSNTKELQAPKKTHLSARLQEMLVEQFKFGKEIKEIKDIQEKVKQRQSVVRTSLVSQMRKSSGDFKMNWTSVAQNIQDKN
jgi:hypothetical protein